MKSMQQIALVGFAGVMLVGIACQSSDTPRLANSTTPVKSRAAEPIGVPPVPVAAEPSTPVPTPSPAPTPPPAPTPTPWPTPTPIPTPGATPSPTPSPTPARNIGLQDTLNQASTSPRFANEAEREAYLAKGYPRIKVVRSNDAAKDATFQLALESVKQAVARKDLDSLVSHIAEDRIVSDPEGGGGMAGFLTKWKLTFAPKQSEIWNEIGRSLELGVKYDDASQTFIAPAMTFATPYAEKILAENIEQEDRAVVLGSQVRARAQPTVQSEQVDQLSNEIVKLAGAPDPATIQTIAGETHPWWPVTLYDGKKAYVFGKFIRPWDSDEVWFQRVGEEWKIVRFSRR